MARDNRSPLSTQWRDRVSLTYSNKRNLWVSVSSSVVVGVWYRARPTHPCARLGGSGVRKRTASSRLVYGAKVFAPKFPRRKEDTYTQWKKWKVWGIPNNQTRGRGTWGNENAANAPPKPHSSHRLAAPARNPRCAIALTSSFRLGGGALRPHFPSPTSPLISHSPPYHFTRDEAAQARSVPLIWH